jgi:hypothetical protein
VQERAEVDKDEALPQIGATMPPGRIERPHTV